MRIFWQQIVDKLRGKNPGLVGAVGGFLLALLLVLFGLWKTLFLLGMTILGYFVGGRYFSKSESLRKLLDKILPPGMFR